MPPGARLPRPLPPVPVRSTSRATVLMTVEDSMTLGIVVLTTPTVVVAGDLNITGLIQRTMGLVSSWIFNSTDESPPTIDRNEYTVDYTAYSLNAPLPRPGAMVQVRDGRIS